MLSDILVCILFKRLKVRTLLICFLIYFTLLMDKIYSVRAYDVHRVHPHMLLPCFSVSIATVLNQCGSATEWNNL